MDKLNILSGPSKEEVEYSHFSLCSEDIRDVYSLDIRVEDGEDGEDEKSAGIVEAIPIESPSVGDDSEITFRAFASEATTKETADKSRSVGRMVLVRWNPEEHTGTIEPTPTPPRNK